MTTDNRIEIEFTVKAFVDPDAMFLRIAGAEITEGEWDGTVLCAIDGSMMPVLSLDNEALGIHTTSWPDLQAFLQAWIEAVRLAVAEHPEAAAHRREPVKAASK